MPAVNALKIDVESAYLQSLEHGIVEPLVTDHERAWFDSVDPRKSATSLNLVSLSNQFQTLQSMEHAFNQYVPDEGVAWQEGAVIELSRHYVPDGTLAFVSRIDTLVVDSTTNQAISDWSNPDSYDPVFSFALGIMPVNTFRRLGDRFVNTLASIQPWYAQAGCIPFGPPAIWNDNRYAWGNPSNETFYPVPRGHVLRMFAICTDSSEFRHGIKGRIIIRSQSEKVVDAAMNARRGGY